MKSIKISVVSLLLGSSLAIAGGTIGKNIEPPVSEVVEVVQEDNSGFYAGLGYSCLQMDFHNPYMDIRSMSAMSITAGYDFNEYIAIEGRYSLSLGDSEVETRYVDGDKAWDLANAGIYIKPKLTMDMVTIYGLLGYGQFSYDNGTSYSAAGAQYGLGVSAMATENIEIFVDYRSLFNAEDFDGLSTDETVHANSYTVGVNYHF